MNRMKILLILAAIAFMGKGYTQPVVLPANIDVSAIGAASYSIPIEVVPGTNGVQPSLSIVYNSMSGLGTLGQKWSLQGVSSITRVPQNKYYDGNVSPIKFDNSDRFALDGNRMLLYSGNSYQASDAVYCFETENFSRVKKISSGDVFYFQQYLPDGTVVEYGGDEQSRWKLANRKYLSWMVNKVTDANGNYMTYHYQQSDGEILLEQILYIYHADETSTSAYAKVSFEYEMCSNPNDCFVNGNRLRRSKRIKNIEVRYQGVLVRKYSFSYNTELIDERLSKVTLYGAQNTVLTTTAITWNNNSSTLDTDEDLPFLSSGYITVAGNFDNDRVYDIFAMNSHTKEACLFKKNENGTYTRTNYNISNRFWGDIDRLSAVDIDGDGIDEIVFRRDRSRYFIMHITNSSTLNPGLDWWGDPVWGDFTGDGIIEHVSLGHTKDYLWYNDEKIYFENGKKYKSCYGGDYDGDGKTDLLLLDDWTCDIYTYNTTTNDWERTEHNGFPHAHQYLVVGDYNGDGLSDVLFLPTYESKWLICFRTGTGKWTYPPDTIDLVGDHLCGDCVAPKYAPFACDLNGDGKSDIIQPLEGKATFFISKGCYNNKYISEQEGTIPITDNQKFERDNFTMGDFDGNGISDFLFCIPQREDNSDKVASIKYIHKDATSGYYVNQIKDAANKKIMLEYSTISLMQNRYSGSGMHWMPLPLVKNLLVSNGINNQFDTTYYYYGDAQFDADRHQFIGFSRFGAVNKNRVSEVLFSRVPKNETDYFSMLMPESTIDYVKTTRIDMGKNRYWGNGSPFVPTSNDIVVSRTDNTNKSLYLTTSTGNTSVYSYTSESTKYDFLRNAKTIQRTDLAVSNWRPYKQVTIQSNCTGSPQQVSNIEVLYDYANISLPLPNGTTVTKPSRITTIDRGSSVRREDIVEYTYTDRALLSEVKHTTYDGLTETTAYTYNSSGLPTSVVTTHDNDTGSRSQSFEYDPTGRFVASITDRSGNMTKKTYANATGLCTSETDINNHVTRYYYDKYNRLTKVLYPDGTTKTISFTSKSGGLSNACCYTTVKESGKPENRIYYDLLGRKTHTYVYGLGYSDIVYNALGQVIKQTAVPYPNTNGEEAYKKWRKYQYDKLGRVTKTTSEYEETTYTYGIDNSPEKRYYETVEDKMGGSSTKYYDAAGRVVEVQDNGGTISYTYGRVLLNGTSCDKMEVRNSGKTTTIITDSRGKRLQLIDPDAGTTTSTYDLWGNLLTQTDGKGDVTTMTYDIQDRIVTKSYTLNGTTDSYSYTYGSTAPSKGLVTQVKHNGAPYQTITYDNLGRIITTGTYITGNSRTTNYVHKYTYNSLGQLATIQYPQNFTVRYEYDNIGRLKAVKDNSTNAEIYTVDTRNITGQPKRCWFGNNTGVEYSYNDNGMTTEIRYGYRMVKDPVINGLNSRNNAEVMGGGGGEVVPIPDDPITHDGNTNYVGDQFSTLQYTYDGNGYINRKRDTKTSQRENYTYDDLGRLTAFTVNGRTSHTFSYQSNGNISQNSMLGAASYSYDSDKPHAVTAAIDENGIIESAACNVSYNSRNRPGSIGQGAWTLDLTYGGNLQREKSVLKENGVIKETTIFISKYCEYIIKPSLSRYLHYIYADGRIVAIHVHNSTVNADSLYYVQTDLLGSWERIVDCDRNVVQSSHFDPWGNRMSSTDWAQRQDGTTLPFHRGFTGHEHYDRFGIINMNARLYDPVLARFFSPDPQVQAPFSTQGFNRYSYCGNNPVMAIDEDGESAILIAAIVGAVLGAYTGGVLANEGNFAPWEWNYSSSTTWGYMLGGAIVGGLSGWMGGAIATSGVPFANTLSLTCSSFMNSLGTSMYTGGMTPVSISFGFASYNITDNEWGWLFKSGNKWYENIGYGLGAMANLADLGTTGNLFLNTERKDIINHSAILDENNNSIISIGPGKEWIEPKGFIDHYLNRFLGGSGATNKYEIAGINMTIKNVNTTAIKTYGRVLDLLTREGNGILPYSFLYSSCSTHTGLALNLAGIPTLFIHPYTVQASVWLWNKGITPALIHNSYLLQNL